MFKDMYVAVSGALASQKRLDTIANNIANVNTPGFKADNTVFESYLGKEQEKAGAQDLKNPDPAYMRQNDFVVVKDQYTDFSQGPTRVTENPLDVALNGEGFLAVMTYEGERYTRAGAMKVGGSGELVDLNGNTVLDESDRPIYVNDGFVTIDQDGNVWVRGDSLASGMPDNNMMESGASGKLAGKLKLVDFAKPYRLVKEGGGLFRSADPGETFVPTNLQTLQGHIEVSNVNMIREMTLMIQNQRMAETFNKVIQESDRMTQNSISNVGRAR